MWSRHPNFRTFRLRFRHLKNRFEGQIHPKHPTVSTTPSFQTSIGRANYHNSPVHETRWWWRDPHCTAFSTQGVRIDGPAPSEAPRNGCWHLKQKPMDWVGSAPYPEKYNYPSKPEMKGTPSQKMKHLFIFNLRLSHDQPMLHEHLPIYEIARHSVLATNLPYYNDFIWLLAPNFSTRFQPHPWCCRSPTYENSTRLIPDQFLLKCYLFGHVVNEAMGRIIRRNKVPVVEKCSILNRQEGKIKLKIHMSNLNPRAK